jgi:4-hydroxybenzoate polyprenyltransferase
VVLGWGLLVGAAAVVFVPQLLAYHAINGTWGPSKTVASKLTWWSPHFFEVLFSPQYGLLMWAPVIALAGVGLGLLGRRDPTLALAFGVALLAQVFIAGAFLTWKGASSFGQRRFINATVIIAFGLAALAEAFRTRGVPRPALAGVAALFIAWNLGLELQYATVWTSAQREAGLPPLPTLIGQQAALIGRLPTTLVKILTNPGAFQNPEGRP